jgi:hypothetical protein
MQKKSPLAPPPPPPSLSPNNNGGVESIFFRSKFGENLAVKRTINLGVKFLSYNCSILTFHSSKKMTN